MAETKAQRDFGKRLKHAVNQMNRAWDAYAKQFDLTGVQMSIIDFVGNHTEVLQRDIEAEFNIRRSTATVALQRMEKRGLITREPSPTDARQKQVMLTEKALDLHHIISRYIGEQQMAMASAFTPAELAIGNRMLDYFIDLNTD